MNAFTVCYLFNASQDSKDVFEQEIEFLRSIKSPIDFWYIFRTHESSLDSSIKKKIFLELLFDNICDSDLLEAISSCKSVANYLKDRDTPLKVSN